MCVMSARVVLALREAGEDLASREKECLEWEWRGGVGHVGEGGAGTGEEGCEDIEMQVWRERESPFAEGSSTREVVTIGRPSMGSRTASGSGTATHNGTTILNAG